ncbi:MAG: hypothetical protein KBA51_00365 [Kiritimatiellae bacterium]|nr:hypothetical protein [Kiritimatiellia bacterium]
MSSKDEGGGRLADFVRAYRAGRLAHAYLLIGDPSRTGAPLAREMVAALDCAQPTSEGFPCGACPVCRTVERDEYPDLCWIRPSSKSRQIRIEEDVREQIIPFLGRTSYLGGWKTVVIEEADCLNPSSANALLKSLEEPMPKTLMLLLTSAPDQLLPTIRSRCHVLKAEGNAEAPVQDEWAAEALALLSRFASSGITEGLAAVSAMAGLFDSIKRAAEPMVEQEEADHTSRTEQSWTREQRDARLGSMVRQMQQGTLRAVLSWHRDALALASGAEASALNHPEQADALARFVRDRGYAGVRERLRRAEAVVRQINRNISPVTAWTGYFL